LRYRCTKIAEFEQKIAATWPGTGPSLAAKAAKLATEMCK